MAEAAASPAAASLGVSVNLSARQLASPGLVAEVAEVITESGHRRRLRLAGDHRERPHDRRQGGRRHPAGPARAGRAPVGRRLRHRLLLAHYLQRFPVEGLKIDRSFVDGLGIDAGDTTIVDTLIRLGHSLGLTVVAEGLETPLQLTHLRRLGCDFAQGFLFSHPLPALAVSELLEGWLDTPVA